jgi:hypothetical protein
LSQCSSRNDFEEAVDFIKTFIAQNTTTTTIKLLPTLKRTKVAGAVAVMEAMVGEAAEVGGRNGTAGRAGSWAEVEAEVSSW